MEYNYYTKTLENFLKIKEDVNVHIESCHSILRKLMYPNKTRLETKVSKKDI